jgi:hypothetical protein
MMQGAYCMMKMLLPFLICFCCVFGTAVSQTDSAFVSDTGKVSFKRKSTFEQYYGVQLSSIGWKLNDKFVNGEWTVIEEAAVRPYALLGFGWHLPVASLGQYTTLWFVPAATVAIAYSSVYPVNNGQDVEGYVDVSVPLYVTLGYGALRRRESEWGVEAGVGVALTQRFEEDVFSVVPSAVFEVSYAPKNVHRLRFTADLLATEFPDSRLQYPYTQRAWSISYVFGY